MDALVHERATFDSRRDRKLEELAQYIVHPLRIPDPEIGGRKQVEALGSLIASRRELERAAKTLRRRFVAALREQPTPGAFVPRGAVARVQRLEQLGDVRGERGVGRPLLDPAGEPDRLLA